MIYALGFTALTSISGAIAGQPAKPDKAATQMPKGPRTTMWQPDAGGDQLPLWPPSLAIQKPESNKPEEVGNDTDPVGGRPWTYVANVSRPTMTIYPPRARNTHAAILVLPGGGYEVLAIDLEGTEICDWATRLGMTCIVLKYRVPQAWRHGQGRTEQAPNVQLPLQDAQRAIGLLRYRAASYGIDARKIGVIGFSAGGHLAAAISNAEERTYDPVDEADRQPSRPDFAILLYPGHLWDETSAKTTLKLAPWVGISLAAPPTLLFHAMNDPTDTIRHSLAYALALNDAGVPVEMHLYTDGGHAFGMRPAPARITTEWPNLAEKWLHAIRILEEPD